MTFYGLIGLGCLALLVLVALFLFPRVSGSVPETRGSRRDLKRHLGKLLDSKDHRRVLVIAVPDSEDFLRFRTLDGKLKIEFPLITRRQKLLEPLVRDAAKIRALELGEERSGEGGRILVSWVAMGEFQAAELASALLEKIYGVHSGAFLDYHFK